MVAMNRLAVTGEAGTLLTHASSIVVPDDLESAMT
jgi:hypothetical protein